MTLSDDEVVAQRSDVEMIKRPHLWPHFYLPLKKSRDGGYDTAYVINYIPESGQVIVQENSTIFTPDTGTRGVYDCPESVLAQGWIVD